MNPDLRGRFLPVIDQLPLASQTKREEKFGPQLKSAHRRLITAAGLCVGSTVATCIHPAFAAAALASYTFFVSSLAKFESLQEEFDPYASL